MRKISIIAAMTANRVIGRNNTIPWRLPPDLKRFKQLTMGHTVVMGRRTFESIGRPLPGRRIVVVTHQNDLPGLEFRAPQSAFRVGEVFVAHSLDEAIDRAQREQNNEVFIAGGAEIYRQAMDRANRLYLTLIDQEVEGDVYFPEYDPSEWCLVSEERPLRTEATRWSYRFLVFDRERAKRRGAKGSPRVDNDRSLIE